MIAYSCVLDVTHAYDSESRWHASFVYGVTTISRLLKIICLFCKRALSKRRYSANETYNFKEPANRSHPIPDRFDRSQNNANNSSRPVSIGRCLSIVKWQDHP